MLTRSLNKYYVLIIGHVLLTQLTWKYCKEVTRLDPIYTAYKYSLLGLRFQLTAVFWIAYGSACIAYILSPIVLVLVYLNIIIAWLIHLTNSKSLVYLLFLVLLVFLHTDYIGLKQYLFESDYDRIFLFEVAFAWLNAKCLSFSLDRLLFPLPVDHKGLRPKNTDNQFLNDFLHVFSYCTYLPSFYIGPIHHYNDFVQVLLQLPT